MADITFEYIETNGIRLHTAAAGPDDGELVVLLHGFPEFWYGWRHQIDMLAELGYRVIAPDQRGYNLSDKPSGVENYTLNKLRDDIIGLIKYHHKNKAIIIGHDWGGAVGWHLAATRPEYVEKLIPINIPHPAVMPRVLAKEPQQWVKSSYMLFFQMAETPEKALRANDFLAMEKALLTSSRADVFSPEDIKKYKEAWSQPWALTTMLNWYRSISKSVKLQGADNSIPVPVQIIWGAKDTFLSRNLPKESLKLCIDGKFVLVEEATHWVHHEQPDIVNRVIKDFLAE